jgi:NitT/TauT family transport system substrate-binding protein
VQSIGKVVLAIALTLAPWLGRQPLAGSLAQNAQSRAQTPPASAASGPTQVGWCSKSFNAAAAPFAVAIQKGWFPADSLNLDLRPVASSSECAKQVASGELAFALTSVEAVAVLRAQGSNLRYFYTAYQSNIYGMAVPTGSAVQTVADLKGKRIGVISQASASAVIARLLVRDAKLDPDRDITLVIAGDPHQTATLLANGALDALSQFDTHYALVERSGVALRRLSHPGLEHFPANGLIALEETLTTRRREAIALARGYAMGTIYATANPEGAIRALWSVWPATKPGDRDEATALQDGIAMLMARAPAWQLDRVGAKLWGEHMEKHYQAYLDWLYTNAFINQKVTASDLVTGELLKEINAFDAAAVLTAALKEKP